MKDPVEVTEASTEERDWDYPAIMARLRARNPNLDADMAARLVLFDRFPAHEHLGFDACVAYRDRCCTIKEETSWRGHLAVCQYCRELLECVGGEVRPERSPPRWWRAWEWLTRRRNGPR